MLPVVTDDAHRGHDPTHELNAGQLVAPVWEHPARIDALRAGLAQLPHRRLAPTHHGDAPLVAVHDAALVAFLRDAHLRWVEAGGPPVLIPDTFTHGRWATMEPGGEASPPRSPMAAPGWWCYDTATPLVAGSYRAARAAVDVALTAADLVADGSPLAYALTRPPGHHAGTATYGGFCLFNGAAVAARSLTAGGRVAVVDVDAHHGNGTQQIFWRDPAVLYASVHGDPAHLYPYTTGTRDEVGAGPGRGTTVNAPVPRACDDVTYLAALDRTLDAVVAFDPATVVVSLGFDTSQHDPIGTLGVTTTGHHEVGRRLAALDRPMVLVQEGGYALDALGPALHATLAGLTAPR